MPYHAVVLEGGPLHGFVEETEGPWPRTYLIVNGSLGGLSSSLNYKYLVRPSPESGIWHADYVAPGTGIEENTDYEQEGPTGSQGPQGPPGIQGPAGPTGPQGQGIVFRGPWAADTNYVKLDAVTRPEGAYVLTVASSFNVMPPGSGWQILSPAGPQGIQGVQGIQGIKGDPGSPLPERDTAQIVTGALGFGVSENGLVALAVGYRILKVTTSKAAWVRFYTTTQARTNDVTRNIGDDPVGNHGVVLEVVTAADLLSLDLSPVPQGYSMEAVPTANTPYRVTNMDPASGPVTVDLVWQPQET